MAKEKEIVELVRDHLSGEEKGIEEILLIQALSGGLQGGGAPIDQNTLLILLLAMMGRKRGGRFDSLVLAALIQPPMQAAACSTTGMPMPATTSSPLLAALALGLLDRPKVEIREFPGGAGDHPREHGDDLQEQLDELRKDILEELKEKLKLDELKRDIVGLREEIRAKLKTG